MELSDAQIGFIGLFAMFGLLFLRMPVALSMMVVGFLGAWAIEGHHRAFIYLSTETFDIATFQTLSIVPMFILMGNLAGISGMSRDLYRAAYAWFGHFRGGLASATILGCAGFAAVSGSSVAGAVTMGRVALPEMERYKYSPSLATGSVAAGGTLGILIPPSTGMIIYAILTETSIGELFVAGVLPGILLTGLFLVAIAIVTRLNPAAGPAGARSSWHERFTSLYGAFALIGIVIITIGGIYAGLFTPVEAAGIGAFITFLVALAKGAISAIQGPMPAAVGAAASADTASPAYVLRAAVDSLKLRQTVLHTLRTTATVFMILIGAHVFIPFMALSGVPEIIVGFLTGLDVGKIGIIIIILLTYVALGTFLEGLAMLVLTLPIVFPLIQELGMGLIWFGVIIVIVLEMGLISPPVGVNVFIVKGIAPHVPMTTIFAGIWPFWFAMGICLAILVAFPVIATQLPCMAFDGLSLGECWEAAPSVLDPPPEDLGPDHGLGPPI